MPRPKLPVHQRRVRLAVRVKPETIKAIAAFQAQSGIKNQGRALDSLLAVAATD